MFEPGPVTRRRCLMSPRLVQKRHRHALGHGGAGIDDVIPALDVGEVGEVDGVPLMARRPWEDRHVGNAVVRARGEGVARELLVEHAVEPLGLVDVTLDAVLDLARRRAQEVMGLAEHRADAAHLPHQPFQGLVPLHRILRQELAGLLGEIDQDRARFEQADRLAAGTVGIDDRRNAVVGADAQELGLELLTLGDVDLVHAIGQPALLQHYRNLAAVGRAPRMKLDHLLVPPFIYSAEKAQAQSSSDPPASPSSYAPVSYSSLRRSSGMGLLSANACWLSCGTSGAGCPAEAVWPNGPGLLPIRLRMPSNSSAPPATPAAVAIAVRRKPPPPPCCGATAACRGERVDGTEGRGAAGAA